jgi:hypothetical protein
LDRWGVEWKPLGGIFLHRMEGPDPGVDLHDHPWSFVSFILWGGYDEERAYNREAQGMARIAETWPDTCTRGVPVIRNRWTLRAMRLDECHRITDLHKRTSWSLVIHGPARRVWGFYLPSGFMPWREYEQTAAGKSRNLHVDISSNDPEGSRP